AQSVGAVTCVDGVSYAPHGLPNIDALGADIYLFSTYKTFGPHQGIMVMRESLARALPNQGHYFNGGDTTKRFTPAGPDHAQVAACAGIADYIDALYGHHYPHAAEPVHRGEAVHDLMRAHEMAVLAPLMDYLVSKNSVRVLGPTDPTAKAPTVALACVRPGAELAADLAQRGIVAGGGDFYAGRCLAAQGVDPDHGVLRLSFVHYTSAAEVDKLIGALDDVI
ncbi:MAG: aminotransferase class V-fold PLP-dependent enzyme, partial [Pseudomonadota bacterium]